MVRNGPCRRLRQQTARRHVLGAGDITWAFNAARIHGNMLTKYKRFMVERQTGEDEYGLACCANV